MLEFWKWFVDNKIIQSDPQALATGRHKTGAAVTEAEYQEALSVIMNSVIAARNPQSGYNPAYPEEAMKRLRQVGGLVNDGEIAYWARNSSAEETAGFLSTVTPRLKAAVKPGVPQTKKPAPHPAEPGAPAAPVVGTLTGVLAGGITVKVQQPDKTYRWYQVYRFPPGSHTFVAYQFNNVQQVEAALGKVPNHLNWTPKQFDAHTQGSQAASAEEVIGMPGNWNTFSAEVMRDAARKAGISDPTLIGKMWSDPQMQQIAAKARIGGWTPEQIIAEQRKTKFWTETLYPGIKAFYGRGTEPERAWINYNENVSPALTALGYKKDADGTYNTNIKKMLDNGVDSQIFLENVPVFMQATQNSQFFDVYRQRAQQTLGKDVTFGDWFSVLKGEAAPELMDVAEEATVAYQAQQSGFDLNEAMLQRLTNERDLSEQEARNVFSEVNQAALALGEQGLARGGLTRDDVLSAAAGIAPGSGMTADEVKLKVAKIAQENDLFDEEKLQFYVGFDAAGRPTRPGLASLRPEGA